jgi:hypothetical protein
MSRNRAQVPPTLPKVLPILHDADAVAVPDAPRWNDGHYS